MALYFYVKQGLGSRTTGGGLTKQTGSMATLGAASIYATIEAAYADGSAPPVAGDFILVSDAHSYTKGSAIDYGISGSFPAIVMSVSDTAIDQYSAGAKELAGGSTQDITTTGVSVFIGVDLEPTDDILVASSNARWQIENCTITLPDSGDKISPASDGGAIELLNVDIVHTAGSTSATVAVTNGAHFSMRGGSITSGASTPNDLLTGTSNGGMVAYIEGVDISTMTGYLLGAVGAAAGDDGIDVRIHGCKRSADAGIVEEVFISPGHRILVTNSAKTSAAAEYQFFQRTWMGDVEDEVTIRRADTTAFPSGTDVSMKATTVAACTIGTPLMFDLPTRYALLSAASTDNIRIYFAVATGTTLTNTNCWAEVIYPDGTSEHQYNSATNRASDIFAAGTTHTDDSGASDWRDGAGALSAHNEYRMDIDTSGDVGADGVPVIRIYLAVPSVSVYFCTTVDTVAP